MSIPKMLKRAEQAAGTFKHGSGEEVRKVIAECQNSVVGLDLIIMSALHWIRHAKCAWIESLPETDHFRTAEEER